MNVEKIFVKYVSDKEFASRMCKELVQLQIQR